MTEYSPPKFAEHLLRRLLSKADCEALTGDLIEECAEVAIKHSTRKADYWYCKQVACSTLPLIRKATRTSWLTLEPIALSPSLIDHALAAQIESEIPARRHFLNHKVGAFAVVAAVSSMVAPSKFLLSAFSFALMIFILRLHDKKTPSTLRRLRRKQDRTKVEEATLGYIDQKHYGFIQGIKDNPLYFVGAWGLTVSMAYCYVVALLYGLPEGAKNLRWLLRMFGVV